MTSDIGTLIVTYWVARHGDIMTSQLGTCLHNQNPIEAIAPWGRVHGALQLGMRIIVDGFHHLEMWKNVEITHTELSEM